MSVHFDKYVINKLVCKLDGMENIFIITKYFSLIYFYFQLSNSFNVALINQHFYFHRRDLLLIPYDTYH